MATLLLTAVGTAVGGPLGGALGALVGQQADRALFGTGSREGPRLKELSVTTSSYGQPIARNFGRMRVAATVIWATDLIESSSSEGGKGKPKTTTYSYAVNCAVALSSTPVLRVGRIWADGNFLRGSNGDLKVEGTLRVYLGNGDEPVDPLISADKGSIAPAFRDCAYVVFENLQLADFGNRIPALTFEVIADLEPEVSLNKIVPEALITGESNVLSHTIGFADEGGALGTTLSSLRRVFPLSCQTTEAGLSIASLNVATSDIKTLPKQVSTAGSLEADERPRSRAQTLGKEPLALRYYDEGRDYQPGVQRTIGRRPLGKEVLVDLPATMTAAGAKELANQNANRARWNHEKLVWKIGELDPSIRPGGLAHVPDHPGLWRVESWEWNDEGIALGLERLVNADAALGGSDLGSTNPPRDIEDGPTELHAFELPTWTAGEEANLHVFAAASSASSNWNGAALFQEQGASLQPIGTAGRTRATIGFLKTELAASSSMVFEPEAEIEVETISADLGFDDSDIFGLVAGANRLLIGGEVLQFQKALSIGGSHWRLCGLLRGRVGTEDSALTAHPEQSSVILLDANLTDLTVPGLSSGPDVRVAAIGRSDEEAVFAPISNPGLSRRPLTPVHPRMFEHSDSSIEFCWTRRARGQWQWDYGDDVPLVEQSERYLVGYGDVSNPKASFETQNPHISFSEQERGDLVAQFGPDKLWVRQIGTFERSNALLLAEFS